MRIIVASMALIAGFSSSIAAQVCMGDPSLRGSIANLGGHIGFYEDARRYGANAAIGAPLMIAGDFTYLDAKDSDIAVKSFGAAIGYEPTGESPVSVCFGAQGSYGWGLEILGVEYTSRTAGPFLALGAETQLTETLALVPYARIAWFYEWLTADAGPLGESTERDDSGVLIAGAPLMLDEAIALGPFLEMPLGVDGAEHLFGVTLTLSLGPAGN